MATRIGNLVGSILAEPSTRGMDLDDPATTMHRRAMAKRKKSLRRCNLDWYRRLERIDTTAPDGWRVEIGSGGGHLEEHIPALITTDLLPLPHIDRVCNAEDMPFDDASVGGIYMINVLHHLVRPRRFIDEAERVLVPGGVLAMIEPAVTMFSRIIYRHLHPEPFEPDAEAWELEPSGPLSGGNDANPWIIFVRDRERFDRMYPHLDVERIEHHTVVSRLLCGGVMMRSVLPGFVFPALIAGERATPLGLMRRCALFMTIVVRKRGRA